MDQERVPKTIQTEPKGDQKGAKREPKWANQLSKTSPAEQGRKSEENMPARDCFWEPFCYIFDPTTLKKQVGESVRIRHWKINEDDRKFVTNWVEMGARICVKSKWWFDGNDSFPLGKTMFSEDGGRQNT